MIREELFSESGNLSRYQFFNTCLMFIRSHDWDFNNEDGYVEAYR
jgi:hypothetical protein